MNRSISLVSLLTISLLLVFSVPAIAGKKKVKVGPGGVDVDVDGVQMKADEDGVEVKVPGAGVKADQTGVELHVDGDVDVQVNHEEHHQAPVQAVPAGKTAHQKIICDDNEEKTYTNLFISGVGNGIEVKGNCELTLVNCRIDVTGIGIKITSNGEVKLVNSFVRGRSAAMSIESNGEVDTTGTTFHGTIITKDNAEITKNGGNYFYK